MSIPNIILTACASMICAVTVTATTSGHYELAGDNCNCGNRIEEYSSGKASIELCSAACSANENCVSFGLWDENSCPTGYCALFDAACPGDDGWETDTECANPTSNPSCPNTVYNKATAPDGYYAAGDNCNCGNRIQEWNSGKATVELCAAACSDNELCVSFGHWDADAATPGYCALFDAACPGDDGWDTDTECFEPTTDPIWPNTVYNKDRCTTSTETCTLIGDLELRVSAIEQAISSAHSVAGSFLGIESRANDNGDDLFIVRWSSKDSVFAALLVVNLCGMLYLVCTRPSAKRSHGGKKYGAQFDHEDMEAEPIN